MPRLPFTRAGREKDSEGSSHAFPKVSRLVSRLTKSESADSLAEQQHGAAISGPAQTSNPPPDIGSSGGGGGGKLRSFTTSSAGGSQRGKPSVPNAFVQPEQVIGAWIEKLGLNPSYVGKFVEAGYIDIPIIASMDDTDLEIVMGEGSSGKPDAKVLRDGIHVLLLKLDSYRSAPSKLEWVHETFGEKKGKGSTLDKRMGMKVAEVFGSKSKPAAAAPPAAGPPAPVAPPAPRVSKLTISLEDLVPKTDDEPIGGPGHLSVRELAMCMLEGNESAPYTYLSSLELLTSEQRDDLEERVHICFRELASGSDVVVKVAPAPPPRAATTGSLGPAPKVPARQPSGAALPIVRNIQKFKFTLDDQSNKGLTELPSKCLQNLDVEKLILSCNLLTSLVPDEVLVYDSKTLSDLWPNLQLIDVSYNRILHLPPQLSLLAKSLRVLNLSGNLMSDFPFELLDLQQLTTLYLPSNNLEIIPFVVTQLSQLRDLHLGRNRITDLGIEGEASKHSVLTKRVRHRWGELACLNLRQNQISDISPLGSLGNLTVLKLQDNQVERIPSELCDLSELRVLILARNCISHVPANFSQLSSLIQLDLSENQVGSSAQNLERIGSLSSLQDLSLMRNGIKELPPAFFHERSSLETLNLAHNELTELPDGLLRLENLCQLLCAFNQIAKIPGDLSKMRSLSAINLTCNRLQVLPKGLTSLPFLQALYLAHNDLTHFDSFTESEDSCQLIELVLSNNPRLGSVPTVIKRCQELTSLYLANCGLATANLEPLLCGESHSELERLDLSDNGISALPKFSNLPFLRRIDLASNKIASFTSETVACCENLELVELSDNPLTADAKTLRAAEAEPEGDDEESDEEEASSDPTPLSAVPKVLSHAASSRMLPKAALTSSGTLVIGGERQGKAKAAEKEVEEDIPYLELLSKHMKKHFPGVDIHATIAGAKVVSPIVFGCSEMWGRRPSMEDAVSLFQPSSVEHASAMLISVFDGHAGSSVAKFAGEHVGAVFDDLLSAMKKFDTAESDLIPSVMRQLLPRLNDHLFYFSIEKAATQPELSQAGCTALSVFVQLDRASRKQSGMIVCANLGDTRAVVSQGGNAVRLSVDHKPDMDEARVRMLGGYVSGEDTRRVNGDLAMSRCLGDFGMRPLVFAGTQDVHVSLTSVTPEHEFLIVGCDGVWDVMSDQEAVDIVAASLKASSASSSCGVATVRDERCNSAARALRDAAYAAHSEDNITAIVILLNQQ